MLELLPINERLEENAQFIDRPDCTESLHQTIAFYTRIGFHPPWIGYYASKDAQMVGVGGFKGKPKNGAIEIAYGTFPDYQHQGIGGEICRALVGLSLNTDTTVRIVARTLPQENFSARILKKNNFTLLGTVWDEEDGNVWEWEYMKTT